MAVQTSAAAPSSSYYPYPYSLDPLPNDLKRGLIPVGCLALLSVCSTFGLLCWMTYRLIVWRKFYRLYAGYNQCVVLIYNLLLADFQQSLAFLISFHWISKGKIVAPTNACFAQAWLLHIGDVASGLFVLAIAVHTWISVVRGRKIPYPTFHGAVVGLWAFALLLTVLGPAMHPVKFFVRAGAWCWISQDYEQERLWLHYLWIFIVEFGSVALYGFIFFYLRKHVSQVHRASQSDSTLKIAHAARYMVIYPIVYVVLTLPLAAGRMATMTGRTLPNAYFCVVGSLITSCGWLDALLYTLTRRVLVSNEFVAVSPHKVSGGGQDSGASEMHNFGGGEHQTVTVSDDLDANSATESRREIDNVRASDATDLEAGRGWVDGKDCNHHVCELGSNADNGLSPDCSTEDVVSVQELGEVKTETEVGETVAAEGSLGDTEEPLSDRVGLPDREGSVKRRDSVR